MTVGRYQFILWSGPWHFGWWEMPRNFHFIYAPWVFWVGPLEIRRLK